MSGLVKVATVQAHQSGSKTMARHEKTGDPRVTTAIHHWAPRFVTNGVALSDFEDVTGRISSWDDWCAAWSARAAIHEKIGREALANKKYLSAGEHLQRAASTTFASVCSYRTWSNESRPHEGGRMPQSRAATPAAAGERSKCSPALRYFFVGERLATDLSWMAARADQAAHQSSHDEILPVTSSKSDSATHW